MGNKSDLTQRIRWSLKFIGVFALLSSSSVCDVSVSQLLPFPFECRGAANSARTNEYAARILNEAPETRIEAGQINVPGELNDIDDYEG